MATNAKARRSFGFFRRKKDGTTVSTTPVEPDPLAGLAGQQLAQQNPIDWIDDEHNEDEQRAIMASLQAALEEQRDASIANLRDKDDHIRRILETVSQLSTQNAHLQETVATASRLKKENAELREHLKEYQVSLARTVETHAQAQNELAAFTHSNMNPDHEFGKGRPKEMGDLYRQIEQLKTSLRREESRVQYWKSHATALEEEKEAFRTSHQADIQRLRTNSPWAALTPRQIIVNKILHDEQQRCGANPTENEKVKRTKFEDLTTDLLDAELSPEQAISYYHEADPSDFFVKTCHMCGLLKLGSCSGGGYPSSGEFAPPSGTHENGSCVLVCRECYLQGIIRQLQEGNWMGDLHESSWLRCPAPSCPTPRLNVPSSTEFRDLILALGDEEVGSHMSLFDHFVRLRSSLAELWAYPYSDETTIGVVFSLHGSLIKEGLMFSIWEPEVLGSKLLFSDPNDLEMIEVEIDSTPFSIPLFVSLFRKDAAEATQECLYCADEFSESQSTSWRRWATSYPQFCGDWVWKRSDFPNKLGLACSHEIDFCTGCLDRHIKAKLDDDGRAGCEKIACPGADCRRPLDYEEIRLYAKDETFATYDQYLNLNALSQFPNFRWCLKAGCHNGQLYELRDGTDVPEGGPLIQCGECDFQMCYTHSVPWHKGQNCKQYTSDRMDPNSDLSRAWIDSNTKKCPSCKTCINKGNACFHMTCNCGFEFCWICLADWKLIHPSSGPYNQNAHKEGCYFRTSDVEPTQLAGTTLDAALERRRNRTGT
ncbi:hypothetical protein V8F06_010802 [Rhypophila decipiens]